jgi:mono/diheme cytochrome c family protein
MLISVLAALASAAASAQMGMRHGRGPRHGEMAGVSMLRHHFVRQNGLDSRYASKANPLESTTEVLAVGRRVYEANCAACHGPAGRGDGEAGAALSPAPANLASASNLPMATDAYLFWTIAEGGLPVGSAMPPFKDVLGDEEIWSVVTYLRRF